MSASATSVARRARVPRAPTLTLASVVASAALALWRYRLGTRSTAHAVACFQRWSRRTCARLGLDVALDGTPPSAPCVVVANHRSYLDIPVLASVLPVAFMSRADVAGWPIFGAGARAVGCVFVERDDA